MQQVKVHDKCFTLSVSHEEIQLVIREMAGKLSRDLEGKTPLFLVILNGAFMFASDLVRHFRGDCEISFVKLSSYSGTQSTARVKKLIGLGEELRGRTVIIIEDIIDTGITLDHLLNEIRELEPADIKIATLLLKPDALRKDFRIDYVGMKIPNDFIVGFGLDYNGYARNYPDIYKLVPEPCLPMFNLILFGPPGAGKGTQAVKIAQRYDLIHVSTGDMFRSEIRNGTELGLSAKVYIDKGLLVPDEILLGMLEKFLEKNLHAKGFAFDGFPRTLVQAREFDKILARNNTSVSMALSLEVNQEELTRRLLNRALEEGRTDDHEDIIRARLKIYLSQTKPLEQYYERMNVFQALNGEGSVDEIHDRICKVIDKQFADILQTSW